MNKLLAEGLVSNPTQMRLQKVKMCLLLLLEAKKDSDIDVEGRLDMAIDLLFDVEWYLNKQIDEEIEDEQRELQR
jgi:hypothetical protein